MSIEAIASQIYISHIPLEETKRMGGARMVELQEANLVEGMGIESVDGVKDRYFTGGGAYSKVRPEVRQLSLITQDAVEQANKRVDIPFTWAETRRNIVISNLSAEDLNNLLGKRFSINGVELMGVELCSPCDRPDKLSGKKGFKLGFTNQNGQSIGGLRVKILNSGIISAEK